MEAPGILFKNLEISQLQTHFHTFTPLHSMKLIEIIILIRFTNNCK